MCSHVGVKSSFQHACEVCESALYISKYLVVNICCVLKPVISVVNFILGHAPNHHQFQAFLEEIHSEFCDLPYHTAVRWLSPVTFYKLRRQLKMYLNEKYRVISDLAVKFVFLVDITSHMN